MKSYRTASGPFRERPYYKLEEVESMCVDELVRTGLYPSTPQPIGIDRFIEKRFNITHQYEELPENVLGFSVFGDNGVESIVLATFLDEDESLSSQRRVRATLAHEAGHVLLHGHLFALAPQAATLFEDTTDPNKPKVLCRDVADGESEQRRGYDGRWWEYQANLAIGAFLMPRGLVQQALHSFLKVSGVLGNRVLEPARRQEAISLSAEMFDVNPAVAKIRINELYPVTGDRQLSL